MDWFEEMELAEAEYEEELRAEADEARQKEKNND